jgi:hypothetical protein
MHTVRTAYGRSGSKHNRESICESWVMTSNLHSWLKTSRHKKSKRKNRFIVCARDSRCHGWAVSIQGAIQIVHWSIELQSWVSACGHPRLVDKSCEEICSRLVDFYSHVKTAEGILLKSVKQFIANSQKKGRLIVCSCLFAHPAKIVLGEQSIDSDLGPAGCTDSWNWWTENPFSHLRRRKLGGVRLRKRLIMSWLAWIKHPNQECYSKWLGTQQPTSRPSTNNKKIRSVH